jgi:hypothetical protein
MKLLAQGLPGLLDGERQRFAGFTAPGLSRRGDKLTQHLRYGFGPKLPQLAYCGGQRAAQWYRHGKTAQTSLQCLYPAPVSPLLGRRIQQQILGDTKREPEGEKAPSLGSPAGIGQKGEKGARGRVPPVHPSLRFNAWYTVPGVISRRHRWWPRGQWGPPLLLQGRQPRPSSSTSARSE